MIVLLPGLSSCLFFLFCRDKTNWNSVGEIASRLREIILRNNGTFLLLFIPKVQRPRTFDRPSYIFINLNLGS